jgi:hypothetical protein
MRYHEISAGTRVPVSSEEQDLLDLASEGVLDNSTLNDRQKEVARNMVSRGLLRRHAGGVLHVSSLDNIERD